MYKNNDDYQEFIKNMSDLIESKLKENVEIKELKDKLRDAFNETFSRHDLIMFSVDALFDIVFKGYPYKKLHS